MAVLPMPCSVGPHLQSLVCKGSSVTTRRNISCSVVTSQAATITAVTAPTYQPKSLFQIMINNPIQNDVVFQELANDGHSKFVADQILTKNHKSKKECDQALGEEVATIIQRLEAFGEMVRESEKKKLMNKIKGSDQLSYEESMLVEDMSRGIVSKFLVKPIQFLTSGVGDLEEKLKELRFLVDILEESCLVEKKVKQNSCPAACTFL